MSTASKIIFVIVISAIATNGFAQLKKPGLTFGAGLLYAKPKSSFAKAYSAGVGAEIKGGIGLGNTYLIATTGYSVFAPRSGNKDGMLSCTPLKIGVKQYLLAKRIFINGNVGNVKIKSKNIEGIENRFSADIGAGVRILGLEAGIYYDAWKNRKELWKWICNRC